MISGSVSPTSPSPSWQRAGAGSHPPSSSTTPSAAAWTGIVNAGQLAIYEDIPAELKAKGQAVVLNLSDSATEDLLAIAENIVAPAPSGVIPDQEWRSWPVGKRLEHAPVGDHRLHREDTEEGAGRG